MTDDLPRTIRLNPADNVIIALKDLSAGATVPDLDGPLAGPVARGHKIATSPIAEGEKVIRYGQTIGVATRAIAPGEHVHVHNLGMGGHAEAREFSTEVRTLPAPAEKRHFMGYHRADGGVGTRNYLGILTSVNCSGSVARFVAEAVEKQGWLDEFENIDGVVPIVHGTGCGMSGRDEGYDTFFLYNHYRPYNQIAWNLAEELDLDCQVFELGLIRPNCVMVFDRQNTPLVALSREWEKLLNDERDEPAPESEA